MKISDYLRDEAEIIASTGVKRVGPYCGIADFLVKNGREFTAKPLPGEIKAGKPKRCFETCANIATDFQRFTYCEGYAVGVIPVLHAWLLDSDGHAIDPTWTGGPRRPEIGWQYFGVAIKTRFLIGHLLATETHGPVLDNWQQQWPILTTHPEEWKA